MSPNSPQTAVSSTTRRSRVCSSISSLALLVLMAGSQSLFAQQETQFSNHKQHLTVSATFGSATVGVAYNAVIAVGGGKAPYRFSSKNLPSGLILNDQTGGLSGAPNAAGQFQFAIAAADSAGDRGTNDFALTVNNKAAVSITISPTSATVNSGATSQFTDAITN